MARKTRRAQPYATFFANEHVSPTIRETASSREEPAQAIADALNVSQQQISKDLNNRDL